MMIDDNERRRIADEATRKSELESRVKALESKVDKILYGLGAAGLLILTSIWDSLKALVIK
jgi:hypothetical protein